MRSINKANRVFSNISACIFELRLVKICCYYATTIFISILDISRKMKRKTDRKDIAINYIENRKRSVSSEEGTR